MPCAACSREVLTVFLREAIGVNLPKTVSPLRRAFRSSQNNSFSTSASKGIRPSGEQRSNLSAPTDTYAADDVYIPFDRSPVAPKTTLDSSELPLILPPPARAPHQDGEWHESSWLSHHSSTEFEPEIVIQGGIRDTFENKGNGSAFGGDGFARDIEDFAGEISGASDALLERAGATEGHTTMGSIPGTQQKVSKNSLRKASRYGDTSEAVPHSQELSGMVNTKKKPAPQVRKRVSKKASTTRKTVTPVRKTHQQRLQSWQEKRQLERQVIGTPSEAEELQEAPLLEDTVLRGSTETLQTSKFDKSRQSKAAKGLKLDLKTSTPRQDDTVSLTQAKTSNSKEEWQVQKAALDVKFGEAGWSPRKKLSPDALEGIRALRAQYPTQFTTPVLADSFKVSPEAIRRILKSKWQPSTAEEEERRTRWEKRGERIWVKLAEENVHPPKRWRELGIGAGGPRKGRPEWLAKIRKKDEEDGRPKIARKGPARSEWRESLAGRIL